MLGSSTFRRPARSRSTHLTRLLAFAGSAVLVFGAASCATPVRSGAQNGGDDATCNVGITMPTRSLERWIKDGEYLQELLEKQDCTVDLQYADNQTSNQISQIQNQVAGGAKILVVAPVDASSLGPALASAGSNDVTVISYDRLILGTPDVDYYASFDNYQVGKLQGEFIEAQLGLAEGNGPFNLEPFAGSPDTDNSKYFFAGGWDVLKKYVDNGQLVVPSGKAPASNDDWASIGILGWGSDTTQAEMDNRLSAFYGSGQKVDAVYSPNDTLALGIIASLKSAGYGPQDWPVITGQDGDKANVKAILDGEQAMTVFKDTRLLGEAVASMVESIVAGEEPEVNDTSTYDNGTKTMQAYLIQPVVVTKDQVQSDLIDSGFLEPSDVGLSS